MIICGIIQSPERNNDQLIIHQVAGLPQNPNSIINAQINLTSTRRCIDDNGIKGWLGKEELYLLTTTLNSDAFGRPIALGIYLKKEGKESVCVSNDTIVKLLNELSLKMDDVSISKVVSFIARHFSKKGFKKKSSCTIIFVVIALVVLTAAFFVFLSK